MIIYYLLQALSAFISAVQSVVGTASVLPTLGSVNLDTIFSTGIGYFKYLTQIFPPFVTILSCATIFLTYKLFMILGRLLLGSRLPQHQQD